jgi:hypothetical protein
MRMRGIYAAMTAKLGGTLAHRGQAETASLRVQSAPIVNDLDLQHGRGSGQIKAFILRRWGQVHAHPAPAGTRVALDIRERLARDHIRGALDRGW